MLVITNKEKDFADVLKNYPNKIIIDLVRNGKNLSWGNINTNEGQIWRYVEDFKQKTRSFK